MAGTQVQLRRGTTAEHATFTGAVGEVTVDTTKKVAVVHDGSTAGGFPLARADQIFASGTAMLFQQTAAPTGWTKQTTHNDKALRVVSGTASSGGSTAFSSVFASRTPAGSLSGGSVSAASLSIAQLAAHTHNIPASAAGGNPYIYINGGSDTFASGSAGSGSTHTHGFTNPTFTGTAMDFAVQYVDLIIATKD